MQQRQPDDIEAQEKAIEQTCNGLRALHLCGFEWPAVLKQVLNFVKVMAGDGADIAQTKAIADAVETAYHEKTTKRKSAKSRKSKTSKRPSGM